MNVAFYGAGLEVELGRTRRAIDRAEALDVGAMPCVERQTRMLIDIARAYAERGDRTAAVAVLLKAETTSREELTYSLYARELVRVLLRRQRGINHDDLVSLAGRMAVAA
ncbi:hypothetical protein [Nonomuraea salmonea]|uniref:hypothetical protein n=1 Tax=Nonomuraea salmonea TaxID=46181 RepID=UPI0031E938CF